MLDALDQAILYPRFFLFVHFKEPDYSGHHYGQGSAGYLDAIIDCDVELGRLIDYLKSNGIYDDTLVYVVTDHGFNPGTNYHDDAPICFLATNDSAIKRRGNLRDISLTIYHRLGIDTRGLQPIFKGRDLTEPECQW